LRGNMSVFEHGDELYEHFKRDECFFCRKEIGTFETYINWSGESDISLHPACAAEISIRLLMDVREVEDISNARLGFIFK